MRRVRVEFSAMSVCQPRNVTRVLDRGALHPQTNAKVRNLALARVLNRENHPLNAAFAETAWYKNAIHMRQAPRRRFQRIDLFRLDPFDHGAQMMRQSAMHRGNGRSLRQSRPSG